MLMDSMYIASHYHILPCTRIAIHTLLHTRPDCVNMSSKHTVISIHDMCKKSYVHVFIYTHTYLYLYLYLYTHTCIYIYTHNIYIYIYIYIYARERERDREGLAVCFAGQSSFMVGLSPCHIGVGDGEFLLEPETGDFRV